MSGALRIETTEWRVARGGVTTFSTEAAAREHAERLRDQDAPHLGPVRVQQRTVTIMAGHWVDAPEQGEAQSDRTKEMYAAIADHLAKHGMERGSLLPLVVVPDAEAQRVRAEVAGLFPEHDTVAWVRTPTELRGAPPMSVTFGLPWKGARTR